MEYHFKCVSEPDWLQFVGKHGHGTRKEVISQPLKPKASLSPLSGHGIVREVSGSTQGLRTAVNLCARKCSLDHTTIYSLFSCCTNENKTTFQHPDAHTCCCTIILIKKFNKIYIIRHFMQCIHSLYLWVQINRRQNRKARLW